MKIFIAEAFCSESCGSWTLVKHPKTLSRTMLRDVLCKVTYSSYTWECVRTKALQKSDLNCEISYYKNHIQAILRKKSILFRSSYCSGIIFL